MLETLAVPVPSEFCMSSGRPGSSALRFGTEAVAYAPLLIRCNVCIMDRWHRPLLLKAHDQGAIWM